MKTGMQQVDKEMQEDMEMKKLAKVEKSKIYCELYLMFQSLQFTNLL